MDWQPIETAPKDGTDVLLYFPLEGLSDLFAKRIIGHWREVKSERGGGYWVWQQRAVRGYSTEFPPSHWMPLPSPPLTAEANAALARMNGRKGFPSSLANDLASFTD